MANSVKFQQRPVTLVQLTYEKQEIFKKLDTHKIEYKNNFIQLSVEKKS